MAVGNRKPQDVSTILGFLLLYQFVTKSQKSIKPINNCMKHPYLKFIHPYKLLQDENTSLGTKSHCHMPILG